MKNVLMGVFAVVGLITVAGVANAAERMMPGATTGKLTVQATGSVRTDTSAFSQDIVGGTAKADANMRASGAAGTERENSCEAACHNEYGGSDSPAFDACVRRCGASGPATPGINAAKGEAPPIPTKGAMAEQNNETDFNFLKSNPVSLEARTLRGWDAEQKQKFLSTVKTHAEIRSQQDLESFARGAMLEDENIERVSFNYEKIVIKYNSSGKLFGLIPIRYMQDVEAAVETDKTLRVKVKMPWYSFFLKPGVLAEEIEAEAEKRFPRGQIQIELWSFAGRGEVFNTLSNILKTKHDTVKNSISNVR